MKVLILLFCVICLNSCQKKKNEKIIIGYYGALTGKQATYGVSSLGGVELAMVMKNRAGGIDGAKIELRHYDTKGSLELAQSSVKKLITEDKVVAIIGENVSSRTIAGAKIAQEHKIPMITPSATSPLVTEVGDYIFRACFIDTFQGEAIAKFAYNTLKFRKAAIFRDGQSEYSVGLADVFHRTFKSLGGEIVADEKYFTKDVIYLSGLNKIKKSKPDFLFVPGYYFDVSRIAFQARDLKVKAPLMGGDGWDSFEIFPLSRGAIEDSYFSSHFTREDPRRNVQQFILDYLKLFGDKPDALAASGFDAANMLFQAIEEAESTEPQAIRDALAKIKDFDGVTGSISVNEKRDAIKPAVILQILNGSFNYVETITP